MCVSCESGEVVVEVGPKVIVTCRIGAEGTMHAQGEKRLDMRGNHTEGRREETVFTTQKVGLGVKGLRVNP